MQVEIEAKFPDIDKEMLRNKLTSLGASLEHPEILMRRKNFDYPDERLDAIRGWIRVRDEGDKVTLSYKQLIDRSLHGTKEVTVTVSSFENTCEFLAAIGIEEKTYQETKREKWLYKNVEVTLDTWPWVPSFVELEGSSEEAVREVASDLGFDWSHALHGSVENIYQLHYDCTENEIDHWKELIFTDIPDWLLAKKK